MINLSIQDLAQITGGRLHLGTMPPLGGEMEPVGRVVVDVCDVQPGDVFWEIETAHHEVAARADDAFAHGALGAVVAGRHVEPWAGKFSVAVQDASCALWQLAAWLRRRFPGRLITVTGGKGRTATTELIDAVLHARFVGARLARHTADRLGLPLSMLSLDASYDFAVAECELGHFDEFGALSHLCCPDVAVINCVAAGGTPVGESADERATLEALPGDGWVVVDGDSPQVCELASCLDKRVLLVGQGPHCDVCASHVRSRSGELSFMVEGVPIRVPVLGRRHLHSALAAFAVGRIMHMSPEEIAAAFSRFESCRDRNVRRNDTPFAHGNSSAPEAA